jgi:hypothetical protein
MGGDFKVVGDGVARNYIARLENNTPATSAITLTGTNRIDWTRGGTAPEVGQVTVESWNGGNWTLLGNAVRFHGGWRMTGLVLPANGQLRARGRTASGYYGASSGLIEQTVTYSPLDRNTAPAFAGYTVTTPYQTPAVISFRKLLANASDADGDPLTVSAAEASSANKGSIARRADSLLYTPATGASGADTFSVTVADGRGGTVTGPVTVTIGQPPNAGGLSNNPPGLTVLPDGRMGISFRGIPGRSYTVQRSTSGLTDWETLGVITADAAGRVAFTDPNPPPGSAFYRLGLP